MIEAASYILKELEQFAKEHGLGYTEKTCVDPLGESMRFIFTNPRTLEMWTYSMYDMGPINLLSDGRYRRYVINKVLSEMPEELLGNEYVKRDFSSPLLF